jgi:ribosomal protein S18 acetylase RimI-like enzyme
MQATVIVPVTEDDIPLLAHALQQLAADLGDDYRADQTALAAAVCGPEASCVALLAMGGATPLGAVLAAPVFSTLRGGTGLFVSDLWVAPGARGTGLARRLLAATLAQGARRDTARFLKLSVYDDNPRARAAYDRLGFTAQAAETNMILTGAALTSLKETR